MAGLIRMLDLDGIVGAGEGAVVIIMVFKSLLGDTRRAFVLFVELGRTSDGPNGVGGLEASGRCGSSERDGGYDESIGRTTSSSGQHDV